MPSCTSHKTHSRLQKNEAQTLYAAKPTNESSTMATEVWRWQGGTNSFDSLQAAVMYSDGSSVLAGYTNGTWNTTNAGGYDFAVVKLDINGFILWKWQDGTEKEDVISAAAGADDGSVIIAGYTKGSYVEENAGSENEDFVAVKIDSDGNTIWQWQNGTSEIDTVDAIEMSDDGSVALVGTTFGDWSKTNAGARDCAAIKLDADGIMQWTWQGGTERYENCQGVAIADNDSVIVAGNTLGVWESNNTGEQDFIAVKLDAAGDQVWAWQDGTSGKDWTDAAVSTEDGSVVLAGLTNGSWNVTNAGSTDFAAVKLDANRTVEWKWQEGSTAWDRVLAAAALNAGGIVLAGYSDGTWSRTNKGSSDFAAVELDLNGTVIWRWQDGTTEFDTFEAAATDGGSRVLLGGSTEGNWSGVNVGGRDFVAVMLERPANVSSSITPLLTLPPTLSPPTGLPTTAPSLATPVPTQPRTPPTTEHPSSVPASSNPSSLPQSSLPPQTVSIEAETLDPLSAGLDGSSFSTATSTVAWTVATMFAVIILLLVIWIWRRNSGRKSRDSRFPYSIKTTPKPSYPDADLSSDNPVSGNVVKPEDGAGHDDTRKLANGDDRDHILTPKKNLVEATSTVDSSVPFKALGVGLHLYGPAPGQEPNKSLEMQTEDVIGSMDNGNSSAFSPHLGVSVAEAVMEAASTVASSSSIPFVGETALLVSLLVKLVVDNSSNDAIVDRRVRWCKSIVSLLKRASELLGKGDDDVIGDAERYLLEDVHDSVNSLVGIMQTYKARGKMSKLLVSSLFKRRQDEAEGVINHAISGLQLGLQVHLGHDIASVGQDVQDIKTAMGKPQELKQLPELNDLALQFAHQVRVEARRKKRQRRLQQLEIPEDQLTLTDVLLGKGGSGEIYLADFSGINAAAKVLQIDTDKHQAPARPEASQVVGGEKALSRKALQRKLFLRELQVMSRLRSPHTVHVYGAITSLKDRFVIVMELMPGGDLHTLLKEDNKRLPEKRERGIMRDICFGMAFLHSKGAIHGDLKSANVLFDSAGMAKIADFGSARWIQHSATTGLATTISTSKSNSSIQMSIPWAAPEVLDDDIPTFKSDVYSFGIIAWEIVSRKMPWANLNARAIFKRVLAGKRPTIPSDTAADVAEVIHSCWQDNPTRRPTFADILDNVKLWPK